MDKYSDELKFLLKKSELEAIKCKSAFIDTIHFLLAILGTDNLISILLKKYNITYNKIKKEVKQNNNIIILSFDNNFKRIIETAFSDLREKNIDELTSLYLFINILSNKKDKVYNIIKKYTLNVNMLYKELFNLNNADKSLLVEELGINLNNIVMSPDFNRIYNREKELSKIIEVLARKNKNNPLLIGEAGVGKTAIVEELARNIVEKNVPDFLIDKIIISLNISAVIAGTKYRGEFEDKLGKIIKELENSKNYILFIDEMHTLIGAGGADGAIDASNILKPFLARNNIKIIGATTINEYKKYIEKDKAFDRRFQKILIEEPGLNEVIDILSKIKIDYERFHKVKISKKLIKELVLLSNKYILDKKEPDRSIDVLDEVCAYTKINNYSLNNLNLKKELINLKNRKNIYLKNKKYKDATNIKKEILEIEKKIKNVKNYSIVTYNDIITIIEKKSNQKILEIKDETIVINELKKQIIGQNQAIDKLIEINAIRNRKNNTKPISILINGTSGTGKTEFVKKYSKLLNLNLIRLDMSEYNSEMSVNKILGSPKGYVGYDDENNTFESLKFYSNSIILLDEIDKANSSIINLLFSILDEGKIKTNKNDIINFKNSLIFLTTNNLVNNENIGFNKSIIKNDNLFSKEFLNRINYIINFNKLNLKDIKNIININLKEINKEYNSNLKLSESEINNIIKESEFEIYGARKIYNIIKNNLEEKIKI